MAGIDGYTKLMLHCDGTDGSTSFPDSSLSPHTVTANGDAQVDTAIKKFGTGSGLLDGTGDYLSTPDVSDWDFGTGDFTIDFWVYRNGTQNNFASLVSTMPTSGDGWAVMIGRPSFENKIAIVSTASGGLTFDLPGNGVIPDQTWTHIALVRDGNNLKVYINGTEDQTRDVTGYDYTNSTDELLIGRYYTNVDNYYADGNMDEIRVSKGIARWTSNFTPPTSPYSTDEESTEINETITLDDNWTIITSLLETDIDETAILDDDWQVQTNPAITSFEEVATLDDDWQIDVNLKIVGINETVIIDDDWVFSLLETISNATKIISHNPLVVVTDTDPAKIYLIDITVPASPTWVGYTLVGAKNAIDVVYNSTTGYYYVACADGIVIKVDASSPTTQTLIDLSDTDNLETIDALNEFTLTFTSTENVIGELYQIDERTSETLNTNFYYLIGNYAPINTNVNWIKSLALNTNFQYLGALSTSLKTDFKWLPAVGTFSPIEREDIVVNVNGSNLVAGDLVLDSVIITHIVDSESTATFEVARNHDNINQTLGGNASELTNQNSVKIYIKGKLEFDGKVAQLDCQYSNDGESIIVTANATEFASDMKLVTVSLPSNDEPLSIYDVLVQNPVIDNPYIDPNIDTETDAPKYFKGIKVNLGQKVTQQQFRGRAIETTVDFQGDNAQKIDDGTFNFENDMTYFWQVEALNYVSAVAWGSPTYKYIGTSLSSVSADTWYLKGVAYWMQRLFDDKVEELGYYEVGEAPFKEISVQNGQFKTSKRYEDKADGFYTVQEEGYNYIGKVENEVTITKGYTQLVADLEYEKLQNINGDILPKTSVDMELSFDAYYYYNMKLLTRINVDNTTASGIFKNSNGFPVGIKTITIDSKSMKVTLKTDNEKSDDELEAIDDRYPDEEDYITEAYEARITPKYKLPSSKATTQGASFNFLPSNFWKDE